MTTEFALSDRQLDAALRAFDAADHQLDADQLRRKDALLEDLLADRAGHAARGTLPRDPHPSSENAPHGNESGDSPDSPGSFAPVVALGRRRMRVARWLIPVAAAAGLVGALTIGGQGGAPAYASWTPTPTPVTGATLTNAEKACRASLAEQQSHMAELPPELRPTTRPETARTVVAERRGDYLFLAMATADGSTAECFLDADTPDRVEGMTGSASTPSSPPPAALRGGQFEVPGAGSSSGPEGSFAFTQGRVGPDVTGLTLRTEGRTVQATVSDGHFAAWWPSTAAGGSGPAPQIAYDVTLAGGTVLRDATPVTPGAAADRPAPGPRQIGRIEIGGGADDTGAQVRTVAGQVGAQVTGVTVVVNGTPVTARVADGTFDAQWPSRADGPEPTLRYDLTLSDGTVLRDQQPAR